MVKSVQLRKEDCYCDLTEFYENVARKIPVEITDKTCFDCRKICVTKLVQEASWSYYRDEKRKDRRADCYDVFGIRAESKRGRAWYSGISG